MPLAGPALMGKPACPTAQVHRGSGHRSCQAVLYDPHPSSSIPSTVGKLRLGAPPNPLETRQWVQSVVCTQQNLVTGISQRCQNWVAACRRTWRHPGHSIKRHPSPVDTSPQRHQQLGFPEPQPFKEGKRLGLPGAQQSPLSRLRQGGQTAVDTTYCWGIWLCDYWVLALDADPAKIPTASPARGWPGLLLLSWEAADLQDDSRPQFQAQSRSQAGCRLRSHPCPCRGSVQLPRAGNGMNTGMTGPCPTWVRPSCSAPPTPQASP